MNCFEKVGRRLSDWAKRVRSARGEVIADITIETIEDLCGKQHLDLPDKFKNYIYEYKKREGSLQSIADYRDHFVHPFHVFVLGYYILNQWRKHQRMPLQFTSNADNNINLKTWFVTSIYHDVGYPAEKLEVLVGDFFKTSVGREMRSQFDWSSVLLANDNIKHINELSKCFANKAGNDKKREKFEKWLHKRLLEDHDHGTLTALMLFSQGWKKEDLESFVYEAGLSIALHSWRRYPTNQLEFDLGRLAVEDFPLGFFLSYSDSAQEWGRRILLELVKKKITQFETMKLDSQLVDVQVNFTKTQVIIKYPSAGRDRGSGGKTLKEIFDDVGARFEQTWFLKRDSTSRFMIEGKDKDGIGIGGFGPRPPGNN